METRFSPGDNVKVVGNKLPDQTDNHIGKTGVVVRSYTGAIEVLLKGFAKTRLFYPSELEHTARRVEKAGDIPPYWEDTCPVCGEECTLACRCADQHEYCQNGHCWHWVPVIETYHVENDPRIHRRTAGYRVEVLTEEPH